MIRTEYSWMESEELCKYVLTGVSQSNLESELANRLELALTLMTELQQMIDDLKRDLDQYEDQSRRTG